VSDGPNTIEVPAIPETNTPNRRRARPSLTDAEREQRRSAQRELVTASIEQLRNSDGWRAYLHARRRLHAYSPLILIGGCRWCVRLRRMLSATCRRWPAGSP
jgi:hypothetical protein